MNIQIKTPYTNKDGDIVYRMCPVCGGEVLKKKDLYCKTQCRKKINKDSKYYKIFSIGRI